MSTSAAKKSEFNFSATKVWFEPDYICLALSDGREIKTPLEFYPSLKKASAKHRRNFRIIGLGTGIHWPDLDEDLSVEGIVLGFSSRPIR